MNTTFIRAISGAIYVLILVFATLYSSNSFLLLFGGFLILSVLEFCKLVHLKNLFPLVISVVSFILFNLDNTIKTNEILLVLGTLFVSAKAILFLFDNKSKSLDTTSKYVFLIGYIILPFIIITKLPFVAVYYNPKIIISLFILIWTNDTFAYLVGINFGKNKLFERISPKKTIEGFVGGIIFALLAAVVIANYYTKESLLKWIFIAVLVGFFGTIGDLIESKFKRVAGVKDSGNIMPGHGGVLDRLDSIIFVAPIVYLFYQILYYVS